MNYNANQENRKILILEDEPLVAMLLEEMLFELGHETAPIPLNLEEAIASIQDCSGYKLAILDANLWGADSTDMFETMAKQGLPIIVSSGYPKSEIKHLYGTDAFYLPKPYEMSELRDILNSITENYREPLSP